MNTALDSQAITKQLAEMLDFILTFDDLKVRLACILTKIITFFIDD